MYFKQYVYKCVSFGKVSSDMLTNDRWLFCWMFFGYCFYVLVMVMTSCVSVFQSLSCSFSWLISKPHISNRKSTCLERSSGKDVQ